MIDFVKKFINFFKLDLKKYPSLDLRRRKKLLDYYKISKILDVGANSGQYGLEVIKLGFQGTIISFEPVNSVFKKLNKKSKKHDFWESHNFGLGSKDEKAWINISENTFSSSLLEIMPNHVKSAPESRIVNKESITIKKIDTVFDSLVNENEIILLKIDVQGFEKKVLEGAEKSLKKIKGIQIEMSIEELYKGEMLFIDMINFLKPYGFKLCSFENGFYDEESGKLLQVDGLFFRD
jgi:FkbM family methyltransferase